MRLSVEWIKEYAPVDAGAEAIAERLTMAGLEVEETEETELGTALNITVTPNRGDCLSVLGAARELAAFYNLPAPKLPEAIVTGIPAEKMPDVSIEDPDLCPRYAARLVRNLRLGESPAWMQARLIAAGMRPVSNIVDVTNYVMLETGQPLHAFDYERLSEGRIVVRRAKAGEILQTLDGEDRKLDPDMLVICDADIPVAVAGVMGGALSEINENTHTLLLESAHFHPLSVRRTARKLDMRTEASFRFERVVDPEGVVRAADRACQLISELKMGDVVAGVNDCYPVPAKARTLAVRPERVSMLLGFTITAEQIIDNLTRLGFGIENREPMVFTVPSWRPDIVREVDLAEEVGRVVGYEHIPERLPNGATVPGGDTLESRFALQTRQVLIAAGLQEIESHSLLAPSVFEDPREEGQRIPVRSALSADLSGLRRSLLPGLIETMDRNARRGQAPLAFFEVGHVFHNINCYNETTSLAVAISGPLQDPTWRKDTTTPSADFFSAKGLVERIANGLHVDGIRFEAGDDPRLHPGRSAKLILEDEVIGMVGELHPSLVGDLTMRERVVVLELKLTSLLQAAEGSKHYTPLTSYPSITRDIAPRLARDLPYGSIRAAVEKANISILEKLELTDIYTGSHIPEDQKSVTLSLTFRSTERTLTEEEVNEALDTIRKSLETACDARFIG